MKQAVLVRRSATCAAAAALVAFAPLAANAEATLVEASADRKFYVSIPSTGLDSALLTLTSQIRHLSRFAPSTPIAADIRTNKVRGRYTPREAVRLLCEGTKIECWIDADNFVQFQPRATPPAKQALESSNKSAEAHQEVVKITATLNSKTARDNDGVTSYQAYGRDQLESSPYLTVGEFLREVTSHAKAPVATGQGVIAGDGRQINLLGLGSNQTVVLIDGRQRAETSSGGVSQQPNLDQIALASIERIEVLTGAASADAGAGALGGVINIVRRRNTFGSNVMVQGDHYAGMPEGATYIEAEHVIGLRRDGWISIGGGLARQNKILLERENTLTHGREKAARNNPSLPATAGAPPLGAGANVRSVDGTALLPGGASSFLHIPEDWDGDPSALKATEGMYNYGLAPSAQERGGAKAILQAARRYEHANIAGKFQLAQALQAHIDIGYAREIRRGNVSIADEIIGRTYFLPAANNPFQKDILVTEGTSLGDGIMIGEHRSAYAAGGVNYTFDNQSLVRLLQTLSQASAQTTRPHLRATADAPTFASDTLLDRPAETFYTLESVTTPRVLSKMQDTMLFFSSPVLEDSRRTQNSPVITLTAQRKHQELENAESLFSGVLSEGAGSDGVASVRSQDVYSLQGALMFPIYLSGRSEPLFEAELSLRGDSYGVSLPGSEKRSANFESVNEFISLGWRPSHWLLLRGGYSTGFLPPALTLLTDATEQPVAQLPLSDPLRNGELLGPLTILSGGSLHLRPENARTYRAGFVVEMLDDLLRVSVNYTRILKSDVVLGPEDLFFSDPYAFMAQFQEKIQRESTADGTPGRITLIDTRALNIARQDVRAFEFSTSWKWNLHTAGDLQFVTYGTYMAAFKRQVAPGALEIDNAGIGNLGPPRFRLNTAVIYRNGDWQVGLNSRITGENRVARDEAIIASQGARTVAGQAYHDFLLAYSMPAPLAADARLMLRLDVRNIFQADAPYDASEVYYENRYGADERPLYRLSFGFTF